jgi:hypothetical protein
MKRFALACAALAVVFLPVQAFAEESTQWVPHRIQHQRDRIADGIKDGSLTRREAHRLTHREQRIRRQVLRVRADGEVSPRERARLHQSLDRQSRAIFRQRHDGQERR